jgi:hypothetical protein
MKPLESAAIKFFMILLSTWIGPLGLGFVSWFIVKVPSHSGSGFWFTEVGGIAVDVEDHVTSVVPDSCVWVGSGIVEELDGSVHCLRSAC